MTSILVLCNHTDSSIISARTYDKTLYVNACDPEQNLKLHIDNITHSIVSELNSLAQDLLEVAAYVYYTDCSIGRGTDADIYADKWRREFKFAIPVSNPDTWNNPNFRALLEETLEFLTGDKFSFTFTLSRPRPQQLFFSFPDIPSPYPASDCICLFSGGIDSLVGSLFILKERNEHPLLVSHRSVSIMDSLQKRLVSLLRERNQEWEFPHLSVWINRMGKHAVEFTQRSRSFLYLSIAAAVASQLSMRKIYISENGVVSVNIPLSGQNVGSLLTRTTHPKFLILFEQLIRDLFTVEISIENPFIFLTKTQLLNMLAKWNQAQLIQATVSCSYTQRRTKLQPQCGTCSQCIGRRFATMAACLEQHDKPKYYEKDVFLHPLKEGRESAYAEGYVRTAFEISNMNDWQFFSKYPELDDVVSCLGISPDQCGRQLYDLFQRHTEEVIKVTIDKCNKHQRDLLAGQLPENCLISMLAHRRHLENPVQVYAEKISSILRSALEIDFQSEKPKSERRLQEAAQAALVAAKKRLRRESPMLSYTVVQTKPDFSNIRDFNQFLFVEMKLLNNRNKLNRIVKEIASGITIYREQGAFVLFVVYDTDDFIIDAEEFVRDLEKHERIKAVVIR